MTRRTCWICVSVLLALSATMASAARIRPGGDPAPDRVIWADPFDNYSQWAWDNKDNAAYQPRGTLWEGGPVPAGSPTGTYPYKSDNGTANPDNGCGVVRQTIPSGHYLANQQWVGNGCGNIVTPSGAVTLPSTFFAGPDNFAAGSNCTSGGWVETIGEFGRVDSVWQSAAGYYTSLGIFTHDLVPRIQSWSPLRAWDQSTPNALQGTDDHPLTFVFYLHDSGTAGNPRAFVNNSYVELNLDDEHAPTDYIWRGNPSVPYPGPECCPEGPYPIICQQVREVNPGNYEQAQDLVYLNDHCPSLVPPYDQQSGTGKTWSAIAFGFLAIGCKDPCTCDEQGQASHRPTMNHPMLFDGNVWRELRSGRGNALTQCPPTWVDGFEGSMQDSGGGSGGNFSLGGGTHRVYLKLTTNRILIWMHNNTGDYCGAFDRVYKGPFNRVAWGVGPGCELQDKAVQGDSYTCKAGGTPTQCLTYGSTTTNGFWRSQCDAMSLLDGVLVQNSNEGACCMSDASCLPMTEVQCGQAGGTYRGNGSVCDGSSCLGACCQIDTSCTDTLVTACSGSFQGVGTQCASTNCPCPTPFADADDDGDVDQIDFGKLQQCYTGSNGGILPGCDCFNRNGDNGIDSVDVAEFANCYSGGDVPWSPGAPCNP